MSNELIDLLSKILSKAQVYSVLKWVFWISFIVSILLYLYIRFIAGDDGYDYDIRREKEKLNREELNKKQRKEVKRKIADLEEKSKKNDKIMMIMLVCRLIFSGIAAITSIIGFILFISIFSMLNNADNIVNAYDTYRYRDDNVTIEIEYYTKYKNDKWVFEPEFVIKNNTGKVIKYMRIHDKNTATKYDVHNVYTNSKSYIKFLAGNIDLSTDPKTLTTLYDIEILDIVYK